MAKSKQQQCLMSLFDEPEPPMPTAHVPGFEKMKPETQQAIGQMILTAIEAVNDGRLSLRTPATEERFVTEASTVSCDQPGFWANKLQEMGEMRLLAARSFIEVARRSGIEHEALTPTGTDSNGQRTYDFDAITRLANKMRGRPESLKPELKTEGDWQEAIEGVKLWKLVLKADQLVKDGKIPSR
jgi:hypothetical protein